MNNQPAAKNFWAWFNPLGRQIGGLAFILNRITALGLTFYLFLHLMVLSQLAQGPEGYNGFIALTESIVFKLGELLVVAAVMIHGLNGLRIILTSFGVGVTRQKELFYGFMLLALLATLFFAARMFLG
jgi:succinate dehydrogenase / fumarate reductase cytochrome b subunit